MKRTIWKIAKMMAITALKLADLEEVRVLTGGRFE